jgi:hypothetical protein
MKPEDLFVTEGPVPIDSPVYVTRDDDSKAFAEIRRNRYLTIVAPRQTGKTSMLRRIQDVVEREYGKAVAYLDLMQFDRGSLAWRDWIAPVCAETLRQLSRFSDSQLEVEFPASPPLLRDFFVDVAQQIGNTPILILVDEASAVPIGIGEQFYGVLRAMFIHRSDPHPIEEILRYNFCFAGTFVPKDLIVNATNSPFNVSVNIELSDFTVQETAQLLGHLAEARNTELSDSFAEAVYNWLGGQPHLTQQFARILALHLEAGTFETLDEKTVESLIPELMRESSTHITHVIEDATTDVEMRHWVCRVLHGGKLPYLQNILRVSRLELTGAISRGIEGDCGIRNRVYERALQGVCEDGPSTGGLKAEFEDQMRELAGLIQENRKRLTFESVPESRARLEMQIEDHQESLRRLAKDYERLRTGLHFEPPGDIRQIILVYASRHSSSQ